MPPSRTLPGAVPPTGAPRLHRGLHVTRKLVRAKSGPDGPLLAAKIGPTPDHFWSPTMVRAAKSGPGIRISTCRKPFYALRRLSVHTHMHDPANMREHALLIIHSGSSNMVKIFATASTHADQKIKLNYIDSMHACAYIYIGTLSCYSYSIHQTFYTY